MAQACGIGTLRHRARNLSWVACTVMVVLSAGCSATPRSNLQSNPMALAIEQGKTLCHLLKPAEVASVLRLSQRPSTEPLAGVGPSCGFFDEHQQILLLLDELPLERWQEYASTGRRVVHGLGVEAVIGSPAKGVIERLYVHDQGRGFVLMIRVLSEAEPEHVLLETAAIVYRVALTQLTIEDS